MTNKSYGYRSMELLMIYSRNRDIKIRNKLVKLNTGLVRQVAHRIGKQCPEPYEDLEQLGYIGLIRAIERFQPSQGRAFSSFAIPYIRGEMLHYLRDKGSTMKIPRRLQEMYTKGKKFRKELIADLGRMPKDTEIAAKLGVSIKDWNECQLAVQNRMLLSLDAMVNQAIDCSIALGDTLADPSSFAQQKLQEDRLQLQGAMNQLEDKTKTAIEFVFLRDLPRKEAAKRIGISPMTVTRHLQKGIEKLGELLQPQAA